MSFGTTFALTETPDGMDLVFNSDLKFETITGSDKVAQDMKVLFKTQLGEDMFATRFGANFMSVFLSNTPTLIVESVLREALSKYSYYNSLKSMKIISTDYVNRSMTVELNLIVFNELITINLVI
jgi:phage baseplate assembly protein W